MTRSLIVAVTALTLSGAAASAQPVYDVVPGYGYVAPAYVAPAPVYVAPAPVYVAPGGPYYDYAPGYVGYNYAPAYYGYAPGYYDAYDVQAPGWGGWRRGWGW